MLNSEVKNLKEIVFTPNSKNNIINIPLGAKILRGHLILTGTVTLAGGAASGTKAGDGIVNLIKRIKLHAVAQDGSRYPDGSVVDATPRSLFRYAMSVRGKYIDELSGSTLGAGAAAAYPIYMAVPIIFQTDNLRKGKGKVQTALNADITAYKSLYLEVETGAVTDCYTGNDRTVTYDLKLQWVDERENFDGDTFALFQEDHVKLIGAAQERLEDDALPPKGSFLHWLVMTESGATTRTLVDTILNKVVIKGQTIDWKLNYKDIRQINIDDNIFDAAATMTGMFFLDFTDQSLLRGAVPAPGLLVQYDVNNPGGSNADDLLVFTRRIFAPQNMQIASGVGAAKNA
jgi:hypothetical protein